MTKLYEKRQAGFCHFNAMLFTKKNWQTVNFFFLNRSNVDFPDAEKSTFIFEMCYKNQVFCKRDSNAIDTFKKMVYLLPSLQDRYILNLHSISKQGTGDYDTSQSHLIYFYIENFNLEKCIEFFLLILFSENIFFRKYVFLIYWRCCGIHTCWICFNLYFITDSD